MRIIGIAVIILLVVFTIGCGGGSQAPPPPIVPNNPAPSVSSVSPSSVTMGSAFTLTVNGTNFLPSSVVRWNSLDRPTTYISSSELRAQISATDTAAPGAFGVAVFNPAPGGGVSNATNFLVNAIVTITVNPANLSIDQDATQTFTATVNGTTSTAVTWSVQEGPAGGSITAQGLYTAPSSQVVAHVQATSLADPTKTAVAVVNVPSVLLDIGQRKMGVKRGQSFQLSARVLGVNDRTLAWSVEEGSVGGSVSATGLYAAPDSLGVFHVRVSSIARPNLAAVIEIHVADKGFTTVGSMAVPRSYPTATRLPNGEVLIAGGQTPTCWDSPPCPVIHETSELFSPVTNSFRATGKMTTARSRHTATLLGDGRVLITGGTSGSSTVIATASAEIYDPLTGLFSSTGRMQVARVFHQATLLANGRVLITGGMNEKSDAVASTEIYDPATSSFAAAGDMGAARYDHSDVALADGKVLVTGGWDGCDSIPYIELFDPVDTRFTPVSDKLRYGRDGHSAVRLADDRVLIAGGGSGISCSIWETAEDAQVFDPGTKIFDQPIPMASSRWGQNAILLPDGKVLLVGGSQTAELFDPGSSSFALTGSPARERWGQAAVRLLDGRVLVVGGPDAVAEVYQ